MALVLSIALAALHTASTESFHSQDANSAAGWMVKTFAGSGAPGLGAPCKDSPSSYADGPVTKARFAWPAFVQVQNDTVYVTDSMNGCIRAINHGIVSSITPCCSSELATSTYGPQCARVINKSLYVMDTDNNQLKFSPLPFAGNWTVIAGNGSRPIEGRGVDGPALSVPLNAPHGFAVHKSGDVYIADTYSSCIRLLRQGYITTVAGLCGFGGHADGAPRQSRFQHVHRVDLDPRNHSLLYVSDAQCFDDHLPGQTFHPCSHTDHGICFSGLRRVELDYSTGQAVRVTTVAGQVSSTSDGAESHSCRGFADGQISAAFFNHVHGVSFYPLTALEKQQVASGLPLNSSRTLFVTDEEGNRIRKIDLGTGVVATVAGNGQIGVGNGPGPNATFMAPAALDLDYRGNIYVADWGSNRIRLAWRDSDDEYVFV